MKTSKFVVFPLLVLLALSYLPVGAGAASVGGAAPDFNLRDIDGKSHQLSSYQGKTVVLEWVNPECPFVVKHYRSGNMPSLQREATDDGIVWLSINSGRPGAQGDFAEHEVRQWMKQTGAKPTSYLRDQNGEVGRLYRAKTTPHMFVINPEGTLIYDGAIDSIASSREGDITRADNYVKLAIAALKSGTAPEKPQSRPYGCSVKY
jgi:hypothetical protein